MRRVLLDSGLLVEDHYEPESPWLPTGHRSRKCEGKAPKRNGQPSITFDFRTDSPMAPCPSQFSMEIVMLMLRRHMVFTYEVCMFLIGSYNEKYFAWFLFYGIGVVSSVC